MLQRPRLAALAATGLCALCASRTARAGGAGDPGAFWPVNVEMTRASGMGGAHAAIATGNDAILVDPAGLAQTRRYHIEADGAFDTRFPGQGLIVSVADSTTLGAATGMVWQRWGAGTPDARGEGWLAGLGYAYNAGNFYFGGLTRYYHFSGTYGEIQQFAQDASILMRQGDFSWALVTQNLSTTQVPLFPPTSTLGVAWGSDTDFHLAIDYKTDYTDFSNLKHKLAGGFEILVDRSLVLRAGYTWDVTNHLRWLSVGASLVTDRLGIHFALRRNLQQPLDQYLEGGLTLYLE